MVNRVYEFFTLHYPCRVYNGFVLNAETRSWKKTTIFPDAEIAGKFWISGEGSNESLKAQVHESQLERKYGGVAEDLKTYLWPPVFPHWQHDGTTRERSDYSSFPEYHPERSLEESFTYSLDRRSEGEVLYLHDLLAQEIESGDESEEEDSTKLITANAPLPTVPPANELYISPVRDSVNFPEIQTDQVYLPPSGCCAVSCLLL